MTYTKLALTYLSIFVVYLGFSFALQVDNSAKLRSDILYSYNYRSTQSSETVDFNFSVSGTTQDANQNDRILGPISNVPAEFLISMKNTTGSPIRIYGVELQLNFAGSLNVQPQSNSPLHFYDAFAQELGESSSTTAIYTARTEGGRQLAIDESINLFSFTARPLNPGQQIFTLILGNVSNIELPEINALPSTVLGTESNFTVLIRPSETDLTGDGQTDGKDIRHIIANWQEATVNFPVIIGFSSPSDVTNPSSQVEQTIIRMIQNGITEIPIYPGGSLTTDGTSLALPGSNTPPDLSTFYQLISTIESNANLTANTITTPIYLRASVTQADADLPTSLGLTNITDPAIYTPIRTLIHEIAEEDRFAIASDRVTRIIIDFEEILASNYDPADMDPTDQITVTELVNFAQSVRTAYPNDTYDLDIFIGHGLQPSSQFAAATASWETSPRNFISPQDALSLLSVYSRIEVGAYSLNPGPTNYQSYRNYFEAQYSELLSIANNDPSRIRMIIPSYDNQYNVSLSEALRAARSIMQQHHSQGTHLVSVFDYGSLDQTEKELLWD